MADFYVNTHVPNPIVARNGFLTKAIDAASPPSFAFSKDKLPVPMWDGHDDAIRCYWKAWELAFGNLRVPVVGSGFVSPFIDTAFNGCLFMWDSVFALMFGRYGQRAFNFQQTLDNFYSHQHADGYIVREIRESDGAERMERWEPASTGPNLMPWSEWEYFRNTGDKERLAEVFPPLLAYTQWFRKYRTWPDGSYFSSGWGCGMDNQPRLRGDYHHGFDHGHMSWVDTTCQQVLADRMLVEMAAVLGAEDDVVEEAAEIQVLTTLLNELMWHEDLQFYVDRYRDGSLSDLKSIGSYWALLADVVPAERLPGFVHHLSSEQEFNRPHRVPSLSADHPDYHADGGYWRGAVWAPTNYMVLRGLTQIGEDGPAHEIGRNHLDNVVEAFVRQGTLFENYAPERAEGLCKKDFVGWTGVPPIAVLFEYVFGLRPDVPKKKLIWDIRLTDEHGVSNYPFGANATIDLHCEARQSEDCRPVLNIRSTHEIELEIQWKQGSEVITLPGGGTAVSTCH